MFLLLVGIVVADTSNGRVNIGAALDGNGLEMKVGGATLTVRLSSTPVLCFFLSLSFLTFLKNSTQHTLCGSRSYYLECWNAAAIVASRIGWRKATIFSRFFFLSKRR